MITIELANLWLVQEYIVRIWRNTWVTFSNKNVISRIVYNSLTYIFFPDDGSESKHVEQSAL
jgi:hypothetical protein